MPAGHSNASHHSAQLTGGLEGTIDGHINYLTPKEMLIDESNCNAEGWTAKLLRRRNPTEILGDKTPSYMYHASVRACVRVAWMCFGGWCFW